MQTSDHMRFLSMARPLILFVSLATACFSQQQAKLRFLAFPQQNPPGKIELLVGEQETIEVETPGHELSKSYSVPPLETIAVGKTEINEEGKPFFRVYGSAKSSGAGEQIVLLLNKGEEVKDGLVVLPLNAQIDQFAGGDYLFINASKIRIRGLIGKQNLELLPGDLKKITPKPEFRDGICQVTLAYEKDDAFKAFFDTRWPTNKAMRSLVFLYQNPQTGRIGISPITDIIPVKAGQKQDSDR